MGPAFWVAIIVGVVVWLMRRASGVGPTPRPPSKAAPTATPNARAVVSSAGVRADTGPIPAPPRPAPPPATAPVSVPFRVPEPSPVRCAASIPPPPPVRWIGEDEVVTVGGADVRGGLIYFGSSASNPGYRDEPSVVDPTLPLAPSASFDQWTASYWPRYQTCSPIDRRLLVSWLASGRRDPQAPIGLVFLYFYGLERRLLHDAHADDDARREVPRLVAEIDRLRRIYDNGSFQSYAGALRDLAVAVYGDPSRLRDFADCRPGNLPGGLLIALGRQLATGKPLTPALAYAWARCGDNAPRPYSTAVVADELRALFEIRYAQRFGAGLLVPRPKRALVVEHHGAASNRTRVRLDINLPDVRALSAPQRPLAVLLDGCAADLERLAKARKRPSVEPLECAAALPSELQASQGSSELTSLRAFVDRAAPSGQVGIAAVDDLLQAAAFRSDKLRKRDCVVVASALESLGYGMEPDVRWLGPALSRGGRIALYRCGDKPAQAPTPNYRVAQLFLQMTVAVASADGAIDDVELDHAREHIHTLAGLESSERARLQAHLVWLTVVKPSFAKLATQLKALEPERRRTLADAAVGVAAADGRIDPGEIRTLEKIYRALALPVAEVAGDVHRALTGSGSRRTTSTGLDPAALARKIEETADVQRLLTSIFAEADEAPVPPIPEARVTDQPAATARAEDGAMEGLDAPEVALLRHLLDQTEDVVSRARIDAWCRELGLMPDGALESLNEAAFNVAGDALFDADDDIVVHADVREHLKTVFQGATA